ncbi:MAG: hypothetical protein ACJ0F0_03415 [Burkholderiaceae bacterium]
MKLRNKKYNFGILNNIETIIIRYVLALFDSQVQASIDFTRVKMI